MMLSHPGVWLSPGLGGRSCDERKKRAGGPARRDY